MSILISRGRPSCNTYMAVIASSLNISRNSPGYCNISQQWRNERSLVLISYCAKLPQYAVWFPRLPPLLSSHLNFHLRLILPISSPQNRSCTRYMYPFLPCRELPGKICPYLQLSCTSTLPRHLCLVLVHDLVYVPAAWLKWSSQTSQDG